MAELIGGATAVVSINSVVLSDHVTDCTLEISYDEIDTSSFGDSVRTSVAGLGSAVLNASWNQDYASSEIDATFNGIVGTVVAFELTPTSASVSATNPKYSGSVLVTSYTPIQGSVGQLSQITTSWPVTGAITRATS